MIMTHEFEYSDIWASVLVQCIINDSIIERKVLIKLIRQLIIAS